MAIEGIGNGRDALEHPAERARSDAERGRGWFAVLARAGLIAKGVSYGLVGILAINLVVGDGGKATSRQGALATLAQESFGKVLLGLLAFGFAGYAIWRLVEGLIGTDEGGKIKEWGKRAGYIGRGLIYVTLTYLTVRLLFGADNQSQNEEAREKTSTVLSWPGGRWLVGAVGLGIIGAGVWNAYRGLSTKFEDEWRGGMSPTARRWGRRVAVLGHLARAVVFGLIGAFLIKAALEYDPKEAIGLDGALQKVVDASYGRYLLGLVAAGLVCYGIYCLVDARYRDVSTSDTAGS
ncbi:MAG: DUF1206 domain-containing protein [Actinomycetota bacterium]|nr:DUF1206 domain-containing protein [Actinomycetota bacterium]